MDNATTGAIAFSATALGGSIVGMGNFWTRNRKRRAETETAARAGALAASASLTPVDRCDRCGAQAYVRVLLASRLELLFCAHHGREHAAALARVAAEIHDETRRLRRAAA